MKTKSTLLFYFILLTGVLSAQPFSPFAAGTTKDFAPLDDTWERNYSLQVESIAEVNFIAVYFLHTVKNDEDFSDFEPVEGDPQECFGWGGCVENSGSAGFGVKIYSPDPHQYHFITLGGDSLLFDLSADSSVFFENSTELYALIFESQSEQTVFGVTDQVQLYRIGHYDTQGNAITSPLHGFSIRIGQNLGLIDFFLIDGFPQVEQPLTLIGDAQLEESFVALTAEMVYDFQEGDIIQHKITNFEAEPFNPEGITEEISYLNRVIQNRMDETDSLRYTVFYQSFTEGVSDLLEWTDEEVYYRFDTLSLLPFFTSRSTDSYEDASYHESLFKSEYCDGTRTGLRGISSPHRYCAVYNAWCGIDTDGPPEITRFEYVPGLGRYFHEVERNGFGTVNSWRNTSEVVYYNKDGIACGQEAVLSASTADQPLVKLTVYPNPSQGVIQLRISSEQQVRPSAVQIFDMSGRRVASYPWKGENAAYDVSELASGLYLMQVVGAEGVIGVERLVVQ